MDCIRPCACPRSAHHLMPGNGQIVTSIAFSPDDKLIASAGYDSTVKVWDTITGALVHTYSGHTGTIWDRWIFAQRQMDRVSKQRQDGEDLEGAANRLAGLN